MVLCVCAGCAACAACADVCGLWLRWMRGPGIAGFGLECELTHTHTEEGSQLPLMLRILSSLNSTTHPQLFPPSKLPSVAACVCIYVCVRTVLCLPEPAEAESKGLVIKHTG